MDVKGDQGKQGFMFMEDQAGLIPLNRMEEEYQTFIDENVNYLAYCPKCVRKIPLVDPSFFSIEDGKLNAQGFCPYCHSKLSYLFKAYEEQRAVLEEKVEDQLPDDYYYLRPVYDTLREESWEVVDEEPEIVEKEEDAEHFVDLKTEYLAYCFGCKKEIAIVEPKFSFLEIDRAIISGFCPFCFSTVSRLLSSYRSTDDLDLNITDGEFDDLLQEEEEKEEVAEEVAEVAEEVAEVAEEVAEVADEVAEVVEDVEIEGEVVQEEDGDGEVRATISALLEDIKEKVKEEKEILENSSEEEESLDVPEPASVDATSLEALKWEILRTRIKGIQEKLVPEVVPSYFKKRILKDLDTYADFNLMSPFSTIDEFPCSTESVFPVESRTEEDVFPILSIITEVEEQPEIVVPEEPEEEIEKETPSLHDLLDEMIEKEEEESVTIEVKHQADIDHTGAIVTQCRSCKNHFCEECATHIRSLEGYGNLSEEMFREYFEPLCLDCWGKFQKRFDEAQEGLERKGEISEKASSDLLDRELYDMSIEEGWKRRQKMYQESRRKSTIVRKKKKESMRERVELLRKIRDIRFRVKKGEEEKEDIKVEEPEEEEKEEIVEEEAIVEEVIVEEHRYAEEEEEFIEEEEEMDVPQDEGLEKKMINSIGMRLNLIPAGTFKMGSDKWNETRPLHRVVIPRPFFISVFTVTQREWNQIMDKNPSFPTGDYLPVVNVSWNDSKTFIKELNRREKTNKYRLPTEAEWEYAARAGSTDRFSFGDNEELLPLYAWTGEDWDVGQLHPVGLKRPNNWGLYDVHGNIWEWVEDKWHDNYSGAPKEGSSWEVGRIPTRVRRGGTWSNIVEECETAYRNRNAPGYRYRFLGFRVVREF